MSKEDLKNRKNINEVLEASTKIHNRLFNHKHFIDGEINYLINKTEKSECKDVDQLIAQINTRNLDKLSLLQECPNQVNIEKMNEFQRKAEKLLEKSNIILELDQTNEAKRKLQADDFNKRYKKKAEEIRKINESQLNEVDKFYERKKVEAAKYYHELEAKWDV